MNQQFRRHRYPSAFPVTVTTPRGRQSAKLIDVNQGGARIEGIAHAARGDRLTLHVIHEQITGTVRWVAGQRIGVAFLLPARPALVDILRQGLGHSHGARLHPGALREMR